MIISTDNTHFQSAILAEAARVEEDALYSMKGHFNAGSAWAVVHLGLGLPTVILAGWAGVDAFSSSLVMTSLLALLAASLAATMTFLNPQQKSNDHKNAGRQFNVLKNRARKVREIDIYRADDDEAKKIVDEICETRDSLNSMSPDIPRWAYEKAKRDIEDGMAEYGVDKKAKA